MLPSAPRRQHHRACAHFHHLALASERQIGCHGHAHAPAVRRPAIVGLCIGAFAGADIEHGQAGDQLGTGTHGIGQHVRERGVFGPHVAAGEAVATAGAGGLGHPGGADLVFTGHRDGHRLGLLAHRLAQHGQSLVFTQLGGMGKRPGLEHGLHFLHGLPQGIAVFGVLAVMGRPVWVLEKIRLGQHRHPCIDERTTTQTVAHKHRHICVLTEIEQSVGVARTM